MNFPRITAVTLTLLTIPTAATAATQITKWPLQHPGIQGVETMRAIYPVPHDVIRAWNPAVRLDAAKTGTVLDVPNGDCMHLYLSNGLRRPACFTKPPVTAPTSAHVHGHVRPERKPVRVSAVKQACVDMLWPAIKAGARRHRYNPHVAFAQAAVESAWCRKAPGNSYFGVKKASFHKGATVTFRTTEYLGAASKKTMMSDTFAAFSTVADAVANYGEVIERTYPQAAAQASDPALFLKALQSGRHKYATAPTYVATVMSVLEGLSGVLV